MTLPHPPLFDILYKVFEKSGIRICRLNRGNLFIDKIQNGGKGMIRECTEKDMEMVTGYLQDEPYGRAILTAVNKFGFKECFQTVYVDVANTENGEGKLNGVYLFLYRNIILLCKENHVDIDFLEQWMGISAPDKVAGRKDNVNIVSWLLTDYNMKTGVTDPGITDEDGVSVDCLAGAEYEGEWAVLTR